MAPRRPRSASISSASSTSSKGATSSDTDTETAPQKRVRLARAFLADTSSQVTGPDAAEIDRDLLARRAGGFAPTVNTRRVYSESVQASEAVTFLGSAKTHRLSPTSCALAGGWIYSAGKEGVLYSTELLSGIQGPSISPHAGAILSLAVSGDEKFLATAGKDGRIRIYSLPTLGHFHTFDSPQSVFRGAVTALAFSATNLFGASQDRSVKVFDVPAKAYVDSLYGHQQPIADLSAISENALTAGGADRTVRLWKTAMSSQLVFRAGTRSKVDDVIEGIAPVDEEPRKKGKVEFVENAVLCVAGIDEERFVSGGDSGSVCLWHTGKKKPIHTRSLSHGVAEYRSATEGVIKTPRPITAIAAIPYGDIVASGSHDGQIRIWALDSSLKKLEPIKSIEVLGFVNCIRLKAISSTSGFDPDAWRKHQLSGRTPKIDTANENNTSPASKPSFDALDLILVAAVGREERLGRWTKLEPGCSKGDRLLVSRLCSNWTA